jgi:hypothetical protein
MGMHHSVVEEIRSLSVHTAGLMLSVVIIIDTTARRAD